MSLTELEHETHSFFLIYMEPDGVWIMHEQLISSQHQVKHVRSVIGVNKKDPF